MAFPVDAGRIETEQTTGADPWTANLPGSISAGNLLFMSIRSQGGGGTPTVSGWTQLTNSSGDPSGDSHTLLWREATGSEGSTVSVDLAAAVKGSVIVWRITGAEDPDTQPPEFSTVATGSTGANTPDPGTCTPTGGSKDYLWLALMGADGELNEPTAGPTSYNDNFVNANSGTGAGAASNNVQGGGTRQLAAASANPGTFTCPSPNSGWSAWTIAFHPVSVSTTPIPWMRSL